MYYSIIQAMRLLSKKKILSISSLNWNPSKEIISLKAVVLSAMLELKLNTSALM